MSLVVGQTIKDRYRIIRVLSTQGGFGNTYLAFDKTRGHDVVIKESKTAADIEQDALLSELRILLSLDHPRLPKVYDGFFHERQLCVTMQYIPGRDVSSYVVLGGPERRADPPDRPTALRWIIQTLEALAYLHARGVVHRDVKPSNLRVHNETGDIFLLDFGISHHIDRSVIRAHSPRFSPPEQHSEAARITPAADVYAVGATLYLLLTGREPPYRDNHYDKTLRLPTEESQTLPVELENIVLRAMRFNPEERYQDAQAMLEALQSLGYGPRPAAPPAPPPDQASWLERAPATQPPADPLATRATITLPREDDDAEAAPWHDGETMPAGLPINKTIKGRYHISRELSTQGGFGTTYLAVALEKKQEVVIKVSKTTEDANMDSLLAERELLSKLKHPLLPAVYEAFFYNRLLCIAMQYIPGRDVSSYLRDGPLDRRTALLWVRQLLEALAYLHRRSIVHCDVKPSNLIIATETGNLFLIDFGISQEHNQLVVRGYSRHYAAPEQRARNGKISPATDVYAVGAILHTFLTGAPPPERTAQTELPLFVGGERHTVPEDLERIIRRALRSDPADRYPHAQAMLDDLQRVPGGRAAPPQTALWGAVAVVLVLIAILTTTLIVPRLRPAPTLAATVVAQASPTVAPPSAEPVLAAATLPEATVTPVPTLPRTVIAADAAVLLAPTSPTAGSGDTPPDGTTTPGGPQVRTIQVAGQADEMTLNVRSLPARMTLLGTGLDTISSAFLQPKMPGQRALTLELVEVQAERVELALAALPPSFRVGPYELLLNGVASGTIEVRDYARAAALQGIKAEYRYLAAIRPFPSIRFNGQDIPGPFAVLLPQPDAAARGGYLRNGDLVEVLDETSNPELVLVRVRQNFDPNLVGREGWIWAWLLDDTPPPPPSPGAIQMPYNIRGESLEQVTEWLAQRGVPAANVASDYQTRERIPEVFDRFQPGEVVSSEPAEGAWIPAGGKVILGVRAP